MGSGDCSDNFYFDTKIRVEQSRADHQSAYRAEGRLKRLGEVYLDGLKTREDYIREKKGLEDNWSGLVVPGVDAAQEAGKLLENLPSLWEEANVDGGRKLLLAMLEAVYVDTVEEKAIVAILPKPAFMQFFKLPALGQVAK